MLLSEYLEMNPDARADDGTYEIAQALYGNDSGVAPHGGHEGHLEAVRWVQQNPQLAGALAEMVRGFQQAERNAAKEVSTAKMAQESAERQLAWKTAQLEKTFEEAKKEHAVALGRLERDIEAKDRRIEADRETMESYRQIMADLRAQVEAFKLVVSVVGQ